MAEQRHERDGADVRDIIAGLRQLARDIEPPPDLLATILEQGERRLAPRRWGWAWRWERVAAWLRRVGEPHRWVPALVAPGLVLLALWPLGVRGHHALQAALREQAALLQAQTDTVMKLGWANYHLAHAVQALTAQERRPPTPIDNSNPREIFQRSADYFLQAARLAPAHRGLFLFNAAAAYRDACQFEPARVLLREALSSTAPAHDRLEAHYNLGVIYHIEGQYELALREYETVLRTGDTLVEEAAFNTAAVYAALVRASGDAHQREVYVHRALAALETSLAKGGRERVEKIRRAQHGIPSGVEGCDGAHATEDLSGLAEAPQFTAWFGEQQQRF